MLLPTAFVLEIDAAQAGEGGAAERLVVGTWSAVAPPTVTLGRHTGCVLASGRVLIAGGYTNGSIIASAELYDPAPNTPTPTDTPTNSPPASATTTPTLTTTATPTITPTPTLQPPPQEGDSPGSCGDGVDNDTDGLVDCADPGCSTFAGCAHRAPAVSPGALLLLVLLLCSCAALRLGRPLEV